MRTVEIGYVDFEIAQDRRHNDYTNEQVLEIPRDANSYNELWRHYSVPSYRKIEIWKDWISWAKLNNAALWIVSANCMQFSITGYVRGDDGQMYNLYITKAHNRATPVIEN